MAGAEVEFIRWLLSEFGPAVIPTIIALLLALRIVREKPSTDLYDAYHDAIVDNTKVMQHLATLLDERTRNTRDEDTNRRP